MQAIAHIHTEFATKFGVPRQPGLVPQLRGRIVFEPSFRNPDAIRGLDGFSHIWLIWQFSESQRDQWSPMVRPPRLGGEERVGVFASRSPFRPNSIGMSVVELVDIVADDHLGPVLIVGGADLVDRTPILDIKPYVPADCVEAADFGYVSAHPDAQLPVNIPDELIADWPTELKAALMGVVAQDPRPAYQDDPQRSYGFGFAGHEIRFVVRNDGLHVLTIEPR